MESRKRVLMNLFARQQWRHRRRGQTYGHGLVGVAEGEGGMCRKSCVETYITTCITGSQWDFSI